MGGDMQPQGHAQVLANILDFGLDLQQAGDAPRFRHLGSSTPTGLRMTDGGTLYLEPGVPETIRRELTERGHRFGSRDVAFGGYQAVARDHDAGTWIGATESRKDGSAQGY